MNFRDPLSLEESKSGCNGNLENGHLEDSVDPLDTTLTNGQSIALKKKRKSSAEKFLEDQSEYYGFQVLPSKLRSSSVESNLSNSTFLENSFTTATTNDAGTNVVQAEATTDAADLGDILGAGEHVRSIEISYSTILNQKRVTTSELTLLSPCQLAYFLCMIFFSPSSLFYVHFLCYAHINGFIFSGY